jgi:hypothetical protein
MAGAERFYSRWTLAEYAPAAAVRQMEKDSVCRLLAHPGEWELMTDYDVPADGAVVGRIMKVHAAPVGTPWMWTLISGITKIEDRRTPMPRRARTQWLR